MNFEESKDANERPPEDDWLDEALARYSTAEPRSGLENRILANLEAHATERRRRWMFAFAGAIAMIVFAVLIATTRNPKDHSAPVIVKHAPGSEGRPAPVTTNTATTSETPPIQPVVRRKAPIDKGVTNTGTILQASIKQEHFPGDRQLSEQERLLLSYLSQTPPQEMEHVAAVQQELAAARQRWEEEIDSQERR